MATSRMVRDIVKDMTQTITELRCKNLLRDERGVSQNIRNGNIHEISFSGKNDASRIVYDRYITSGQIIDTLLSEQQYTILLYDKSIIQAEFIVSGNTIIKERLVFMKKHNKIWTIEEIENHEIDDEDWFAEEMGIPIILRVDYAPDDHRECDHAAVHLTVSNHESCRIPIKGVVTFSEFVRFVLFHFYNTKLDINTYRFSIDDTITELEQEMIHMSWS